MLLPPRRALRLPTGLGALLLAGLLLCPVGHAGPPPAQEPPATPGAPAAPAIDAAVAAEQRLTEALRQAGEQFTDADPAGRTLPRSRALVAPVRRALAAAEAAGSRAEVVGAAARATAMFSRLEDLWERTLRRASHDLSVPCDELQQAADAFNVAAGIELVHPPPPRPRGICLFCGNACPIAAAEQLLGDMRSAVGDALAEAAEAASRGEAERGEPERGEPEPAEPQQPTAPEQQQGGPVAPAGEGAPGADDPANGSGTPTGAERTESGQKKDGHPARLEERREEL